jgi:hypothetical protein
MEAGDITRAAVAVLRAVVPVAKEGDVVVDVIRSPRQAMVSMLFLFPEEFRCHLDTFP